jgi:hypothetical protein
MTHARKWVGAVVVVGLLGLLGLSGSQERAVGVAGADSAVKKVECDTGQTLTDALKKAKPGDTLQVTGTCQERVTITTNRLTVALEPPRRTLLTQHRIPVGFPRSALELLFMIGRDEAQHGCVHPASVDLPLFDHPLLWRCSQLGCSRRAERKRR